MIVLHKPSSEILKSILPSNDTVKRSINEMANDIEFLCLVLRTTEFLIQLNKSSYLAMNLYFYLMSNI